MYYMYIINNNYYDVGRARKLARQQPDAEGGRDQGQAAAGLRHERGAEALPPPPGRRHHLQVVDDWVKIITHGHESLTSL